jgi:hypothetical protein
MLVDRCWETKEDEKVNADVDEETARAAARAKEVHFMCEERTEKSDLRGVCDVSV